MNNFSQFILVQKYNNIYSYKTLEKTSHSEIVNNFLIFFSTKVVKSGKKCQILGKISLNLQG